MSERVGATSPAPAVLFLDIDGVLLSTSTWDLPANGRLLRDEESKRMTTAEFSGRAQFDPVAVMLVNRLCRRTEARIVLATSWRYSFGIAETRDKLVEQGMDATLFHADYACPTGRPLDKVRDILKWQDAHVETQSSLAVDDEQLPGVRQVVTDPVAGFGVREYRIVCAMLGGIDRPYGVHPVDGDDMTRVLAAFGGDTDRAFAWLHKTQGGKTRSAHLDRTAWKRRHGGDSYADAMRIQVWRQLPDEAGGHDAG